MGVKGLTSLVEQHTSLFTAHRLHDTRLVIDGYALLFFLYYNRPCDDGHHGGRYQSFASKCRQFFHNLSRCNISPYLVFDGAFEKDNKKLAEIKRRTLDRIRTAVAVSSCGSGVVVSLCTTLVFKNVLVELGIPHVFCDFEADAETAALANVLNCPAASRDSDFYIMDLKAGYLPLDHLDWRNPRKVREQESGSNDSRRRGRRQAARPAVGQMYIECMKFQGSALCKKFQIRQALLPVFATAAGNDYKDTFGAALDPFHGFVHSRFSRSRTGSKSFNQIMDYFSWLSGIESVEEAIRDMISHARGPERARLRRLIEASLAMYHLPDSLTLTHFADNPTSSFHSKLAESTPVPPWFVDLLHRGRVTAMCANVLCNQRVFLSIQVEDVGQVSAGAASSYIRSVLYGILLRNLASAAKRPPVVEEYAQSAGRLKQSIVEPTYQIRHPHRPWLEVPNLADVPALPEHHRREVLLATAGLEGATIANVHAVFKLAIGATSYLLRCAKPPIHSDQVIALVYSWLHGVAVGRQACFSKGQHMPEALNVGIENSDVGAMLGNCKPYENNRLDSSRLDGQVVQAMAQWQQCLIDLTYLNQVLLRPLPHPDVVLLYNGPLVHSICRVLRAMPAPEQRQWVLVTLLRGTGSAVKALFHGLLEPFQALLLPRVKKGGKRGRQGASRGRGRQASGGFTPSRRPTPEQAGESEVAYRPTVPVSCRFNALNH